MRLLKVDGMKVVHVGLVWPHENIDPCTKEAIPFLERNESIVTWVQPIGGTVEDQLPTIRVEGKGFYLLSLRSMKVVFRHIRLNKSFVNREKNAFGEWKLRIPTSLMREKMRTQIRFNVSGYHSVFLFYTNFSFLCVFLQALRSGKHMASSSSGTHTGNGISNKIHAFVEGEILPFCHMERTPISFFVGEKETMQNVMHLVVTECPSLLKTRDYFVDASGQAYDDSVLNSIPVGQKRRVH